MTSKRRCTVDGCNRPHRARGWCAKHYLQWLNAGKTGQPVERVARTECVVDGCTTAPRSMYAEHCEMHYGRLRRTGTTDAPARPAPAPVEDVLRMCEQCGRVPVKRRFCSPRCTNRWHRGIDESAVRACLECGDPIGRERRVDAVFCSVRCGLAARAGRTTSAVTGGVAFLGRRDGWTCHLCGEPVDPAVRWPHPRCGTVDHVVPVSKGGTDDPDNLALAHNRCNIQKGNRS